MGGTITAQSKIGEGSTFEVSRTSLVAVWHWHVVVIVIVIVISVELANLHIIPNKEGNFECTCVPRRGQTRKRRRQRSQGKEISKLRIRKYFGCGRQHSEPEDTRYLSCKTGLFYFFFEISSVSKTGTWQMHTSNHSITPYQTCNRMSC